MKGVVTMLNFGCDYLEGAHEKILARFIETNMEKEPGYGADKYTISNGNYNVTLKFDEISAVAIMS